MPGFGGIEVYNAIRSRRPGLEARIVFMTGGAFTSQIEDFLDSGSYRCLDKPFNRKQVLDLIEAVSRG
jgi:CheY-like chemotaxis protein